MRINRVLTQYSSQLQYYHNEKNKILEQKREIEKAAASDITNKNIYAKQLIELDCAYEEASKKYDSYHKLMEQLSVMEMALANAEVAKQQSETIAEEAKNMSKIYEVARRIANGDTVPPKDEHKLMEYSMEMYLGAKSVALVNRDEESKGHESLWDEEEDDTMTGVEGCGEDGCGEGIVVNAGDGFGGVAGIGDGGNG